MKQDLVTARNTVTGRVGRVPRVFVEHPVIGASLEIVPDGSRSKIRVKAESRPVKPAETPAKEDDK